MMVKYLEKLFSLQQDNEAQVNSVIRSVYNCTNNEKCKRPTQVAPTGGGRPRRSSQRDAAERIC